MMYPNPEGGGDLHYQSFYVPLRGSGGEVEGTIGLSLDVTGERRTEHALREQLGIIEAQSATLLLLGRILRATPLLLVGLDRQGVVTLAEGEGFALVGMECAAAVGQNALELFPENTFVEACIRALGGEEQRVTAPLRDGVWFDSWFLPMRDDRGDVTGITIFGVDATERKLAEHELRDKLQLIERQSATIRALATPIIKVWNEILCLPVVGTLDSARTAEMMDSLLQAIVREQARFAIIDLTGVEIVDTSTADHIIQLFRAASVLGVEGILCGIRPAVAQTVVALGVDLTQIHTMRTLEDALRFCLRSGAATAKEERSAKPRAGAKGATGLTAPRRR
jgi:rsbT co-antagonist protein RsbR